VHELEDPEEAQEFCQAQGWTDGLPVVPPTEARVRAMLEATRRGPRDVVGVINAIHRPITVDKVAINAVMAGCLPAYLPLLLAALEAMCDPVFNFHGPAASTKSGAPLVVVNGPVRRALGVNAGVGLFGPGWRANATIGRAIRLVMRNVGGYRPGEMDRGTMGSPARYTYVIAENEEESPWTPLHVERGFSPGDSCVTVYAAEAPQQVNDHHGRRPEEILATVADSMARLGNFNVLTGPGEHMVVLGGEHTRDIAGAGWDKSRIRAFLFEHCRRAADLLKRRGSLPGPVEPGDEGRLVPMVAAPGDIMIVAAGGAGGRFSSIIPCWAGTSASRAVTRRIEDDPPGRGQGGAA
jgi:hypothetical protein